MWGQDWDVRQLWGCAREGKGECVEGLGGLSVHMEGAVEGKGEQPHPPLVPH